MRVSLSAVVLAVSVTSGAALGQCPDAHWQTGNGIPGVIGAVSATGWWDPDGPGPTPAYPVIGGDFSVAYSQSDIGGTVLIRNLVAWDGGRWIPLLPTGMAPTTAVTGAVIAMANLPTGELVVAGSVSNIGGVSVVSIAKWNGTAWSPLGAGLNGNVVALAVLPNGDLVAGGAFTMSGATTVGHLARWNGTTWSAFAPTSPTSVTSMATLGDGSLVVVGSFSSPSGPLARWNGSAWVGFPGNLFSINDVVAVPGTTNQFVVGGGFFELLGGPLNLVARWDGSAWVGLGSGLGHNNGSETVNTLCARPNGEIVVGGQYTSSRAFGATPADATVSHISVWNGTGWNTMNGGADGFLYSLSTMPNGDVLAGGNAGSFGGLGANMIGRWNGAGWSGFGNGFGGVRAMVEIPESAGGGVIMGGADQRAGGVAVNRIAKWDGTKFNALGTGFNLTVNAVARLNNGDIVAGGDFTQAGATVVGRIARFNGTSWSQMGGNGLTAGGEHINALCVRPNGDLVAAGLFQQISGVAAANIARWDGNSWTPMATGPGSEIYSAIALPNGDVIVGGAFAAINGVAAPSTARWVAATGTWTAMGTGPGGFAWGLARCANGDILACGDFSQAVPTFRRYRVARWNGSTWTPIGSEPAAGVAIAYSVIERPDGSIVVGGNFANSDGIATPNIARWNGTAWSGLEQGTSSHVRVMLNHSSGELWAGGLFSYANRFPALGWARFACLSAPTCGADLDDGSGTGTPDGAVTIEDLLYMLEAFESGSIAGDLDDDGDPAVGNPDGAVTIDDLIYMLSHFETGC